MAEKLLRGSAFKMKAGQIASSDVPNLGLGVPGSCYF